MKKTILLAGFFLFATASLFSQDFTDNAIDRAQNYIHRNFTTVDEPFMANFAKNIDNFANDTEALSVVKFVAGQIGYQPNYDSSLLGFLGEKENHDKFYEATQAMRAKITATK